MTDDYTEFVKAKAKFDTETFEQIFDRIEAARNRVLPTLARA